MYTDIRHDLGAYAHAHSTHALPAPNADIQRKLHRLIQETGLAYDTSFAKRDPRLQHCMLLAGAGLLVTAIRAQAPLLTANCADLACLADLNVLLVRFCSHPTPSSRSVACSFTTRAGRSFHAKAIARSFHSTEDIFFAMRCGTDLTIRQVPDLPSAPSLIEPTVTDNRAVLHSEQPVQSAAALF